MDSAKRKLESCRTTSLVKQDLMTKRDSLQVMSQVNGNIESYYMAGVIFNCIVVVGIVRRERSPTSKEEVDCRVWRKFVPNDLYRGERIDTTTSKAC